MEFGVASKLLDACVLGIIASGDTYGYDLTQKLGGSLEISETALYPVLRRLSKSELLTTYDKAYDGRNRKYYAITEKGIQKLDYYKECWGIHKNVVDEILKHDENKIGGSENG